MARVVVITGAGGIGSETARSFAENGCRVAVVTGWRTVSIARASDWKGYPGEGSSRWS